MWSSRLRAEVTAASILALASILRFLLSLVSTLIAMSSLSPIILLLGEAAPRTTISVQSGRQAFSVIYFYFFSHDDQATSRALS